MSIVFIATQGDEGKDRVNDEGFSWYLIVGLGASILANVTLIFLSIKEKIKLSYLLNEEEVTSEFTRKVDANGVTVTSYVTGRRREIAARNKFGATEKEVNKEMVTLEGTIDESGDKKTTAETVKDRKMPRGEALAYLERLKTENRTHKLVIKEDDAIKTFKEYTITITRNSDPTKQVIVERLDSTSTAQDNFKAALKFSDKEISEVKLVEV